MDDKKKIILDIKKLQKNDHHGFDNGKSWGTVYTKVHEIAKLGLIMGLNQNLMYKDLFKSQAIIENYIINWYLKLFNSKKIHSETNKLGQITSSGTISNLTACLVGKLLYGSNEKNEIIVPEHFHFSIKKVATILGLKIIIIPFTDNLEIDYKLTEKLITKNTFMIVSTYGTTSFGYIDKIDHFSKLALKYNLYLHVDAAYGGMLFPFLDKNDNIGFNLKGVHSITVCPHKLGRCPTGVSVLLFKDSKPISKLYDSFLDKKLITIVNSIEGSRNGGTVLGTRCMLKYYGFSKYKKDAEELLTKASYLKKLLKDNLNVAILNPNIETNIVIFKLTGIKLSNNDIKKLMRTKGFFFYEIYGYIRLFVNHHHNHEDCDNFVNTLFNVIKLKNSIIK